MCAFRASSEDGAAVTAKELWDTFAGGTGRGGTQQQRCYSLNKQSGFFATTIDLILFLPLVLSKLLTCDLNAFFLTRYVDHGKSGNFNSPTLKAKKLYLFIFFILLCFGPQIPDNSRQISLSKKTPYNLIWPPLYCNDLQS